MTLLVRSCGEVEVKMERCFFSNVSARIRDKGYKLEHKMFPVSVQAGDHRNSAESGVSSS